MINLSPSKLKRELTPTVTVSTSPAIVVRTIMLPRVDFNKKIKKVMEAQND